MIIHSYQQTISRLQAEIIRLKTELEDRELVIESSRKDATKLMGEAAIYKDRLGKAEVELHDADKKFKNLAKLNTEFKGIIVRQDDQLAKLRARDFPK